jgi:tetratricopeptide (TPR) repeat protein
MSELVRNILFYGIVSLVLGSVVVVTTIKAEDPALMAFRWVLTVIVLVFMFLKALPSVMTAPIAGLQMVLLCGVVMAITWRRALASLVANPFGNLFDGGNVPPEPRPAYSVAQARQKQGKYLEAVAEVRKQLQRFPTDFEGHMLLAQIQAEDLKDLPGAEQTIQQLCAQPGHAPANIAFALYSLADWQLKLARDGDAARRALEQVTALLPESEFAFTAAQRIAHLGNTEMLLPPEERKKFTVVASPRNLGLRRPPQTPELVETGPGQHAAELVKHLEEHPLDTEAREQLAAIYADHYDRLDLALDQLEQMIQQPHRPHKLAVRWLNMMADLQIRHGADFETVKATLQRIIDLDPKAAPAEIARNRIGLLKLEIKAKETKQAVKMGSYDQNIGLTRERTQRG